MIILVPRPSLFFFFFSMFYINFLINMVKPKHAAIIDAQEMKFAEKILTNENRWQNWEKIFPSETVQLYS